MPLKSQSGDDLEGSATVKITVTDAERHEVIRRYVDREIVAEEAADALGPGTAIVDVILEAKCRFGRLPDQRDAFAEGEYRRALAMLGLDKG